MGDRSTEIDQLAKALVAMQSEMKPVERSAKNPFFNSEYSPLAKVMETAQPLLAKHKLAVINLPSSDDSGNSYLTTYIMHESGQFISEKAPLLLAKQDSQGQGSAITYARRYGTMGALGMVSEEDDDGNAASSRQPAKSKPFPATTKQLQTLLGMAKDNGFNDKDKAIEYLTGLSGKPLNDLTVSEASKLIAKLTDRKGGGDVT